MPIPPPSNNPLLFLEQVVYLSNTSSEDTSWIGEQGGTLSGSIASTNWVFPILWYEYKRPEVEKQKQKQKQTKIKSNLNRTIAT